jgi:hypothetical protein
VRRAELAGELEAPGAVLVDGPGLAKKVALAAGGAPIRFRIDAVTGRGLTHMHAIASTAASHDHRLAV